MKASPEPVSTAGVDPVDRELMAAQRALEALQREAEEMTASAVLKAKAQDSFGPTPLFWCVMGCLAFWALVAYLVIKFL